MTGQIQEHQSQIFRERVKIWTEQAMIRPRTTMDGDEPPATAQVAECKAPARGSWKEPLLLAGQHHFNRGSRASRSASPKKLNASTATKMAAPGAIAIHGSRCM